MFFTSIRMGKTPFYVDLSKLIISNYPHLQNFIESQIFWCFDNSSDLYVYKSIEKGLLREENLTNFENFLKFEFSFYFITNISYNPIFRYLRFIYLAELNEIDLNDLFFSSYYLQNQKYFEDKNYRQNMRICENTDQTAAAIRRDDFEFIGTENKKLEANIIERNELLCFGCSLLHYSAFYGSFNCFKKLFESNNDQKSIERMNVTTYSMCGKCYSNRFELTLCDFAACGGNLRICEMIQKEGFQFTSQSLQFAIRYHRREVFEWLINDQSIEMDEKCYKDSFRYEFVPGIEFYRQHENFENCNVNLELSKSGNYVLFTKFINPDPIVELNSGRSYYNHEQLMPIFLYNSIDCYRFIFGTKIDLNECSWFDDLYGRYDFMVGRQYRNPFHVAISRQFIDLIQMILKFSSININKKMFLTSTGGCGTLCLFRGITMPPLEIAINTDNPDIVQLLLSIDEIDVNAVSGNSGRSSYSCGRSDSSLSQSIIRVAALRGNLVILEILLKSPRIDKSIKSNLNTDGSGYSMFNNINEEPSVTKDISNQEIIDLLARYGIK